MITETVFNLFISSSQEIFSKLMKLKNLKGKRESTSSSFVLAKPALAPHLSLQQYNPYLYKIHDN